jgi:hypothetical protein
MSNQHSLIIENAAVPMLNKRKREIETSISNILSAIEQGIFGTSTKQRLEELESQKRDLKSKYPKKIFPVQHSKRNKLYFGFTASAKCTLTFPRIAEDWLIAL